MEMCDNPQCSTSTDIAGFLSHGWGKLDDYGFWEITCPKAHSIDKEHYPGHENRIGYDEKCVTCRYRLYRGLGFDIERSAQLTLWEGKEPK